MDRTYIGARYVPIFANPVEWDLERSYEYLTIVTHNGDSYTSKRAVPAGTSITNTDYWVLTGNYNQAVSQLRTEVNELTESVASLNDEVSNNTSDISVLNNMASVKDTVLITDSYGNYPTPQTSYVTLLKQREELGTIYSTANNGYGFATSNTFTQSMQTLASTLNASQRDNVKRVVVIGGANDRSFDINNIRTGINNFVTAAKQLFTNAQVYIGFVGYNTAWSDVATMYETMRAYCTCTDFGAVYLTGVDQSLRRLGIGSDTLHPNDYGARTLYRGVYNSIMTGAYNCITEQRQLDWSPSGIANSIDGINGIMEWRRNGMVNYYVSLSGNYITVNCKNQNFTSTRCVEIATVNNADVTWRGQSIGVCPMVRAGIGDIFLNCYLKYGRDQKLWLFIPGTSGLTNINSIILTGNLGVVMDDFYAD